MKRYRNDPNAPKHLRMLADAARGDELSEARRQKAAERLGLVAVASTSAPPEPSSAPSRLRLLSSSGSIAVTGIAVIGAALGLGAASSPRAPETTDSAPLSSVVLKSSPPPRAIVAVAPDAPAVSVAQAESEPAPRELAPSTNENVASVDVASLPDVKVKPSASLASPTPHAAPLGSARCASCETDDVDDLRPELDALDTVRRAFTAGQLANALHLLDAYASKFPNGKLRQEALVLRIEALYSSGDRTSADKLAQRLFATSPNTPYAARVRAAGARPSREEL